MLVTGGAGFIGANFVRVALAGTDARIVVLDKLTYAGHRISLADSEADPRVEFVQGDIADRDCVRDLFARHRPRWVLNFAAESHVDRSIDGPREFIESNTIGAFELLEAARAQQEGASDADRAAFRFLHVSTDEVYGSLGSVGAFSETTPYAPNSPYSASKAAADHLVRAWFHTFGLPTLITNCSNNYGPFQFPEKLVPLMLLNALEGRDLPIYGDGGNVRDWIFVEDHCDGILRVLQRGRPGEKYNLGGGGERTNLEIVQLLCSLVEEFRPAAENEALRARSMKSYNELQKFVTDRPGHDRRYAIDGRKVARELDWQPATSIEDGFRRTVQWYLESSDWCRQVQAEDTAARERIGLGAKV